MDAGQTELLAEAHARGYLLTYMHRGRKGSGDGKMYAAWSRYCEEHHIPDVRVMVSAKDASISYRVVAGYALQAEGLAAVRNMVMYHDKRLGKKSWDMLGVCRGCIDHVATDKLEPILVDLVRLLRENMA